MARLTHQPRVRTSQYIARLAKNPYKTATCAYCGDLAQTKDHLVPRLYAGFGIRKGRERNFGKTVDACRQCNSFLGSKLIVTLVDRAYNLWCNPKVQKRYNQERLDYLWSIAKDA